MVRKKGTKRKASTGSGDLTNGNAPLLPPDRATWPGWVEIESEPAFFSVMLKEMGVQGIKVQEVYGLDDEMLAILPQPVHALIFLFRYRDVDEIDSEKGKECPDHVWFANQIPDFACATVALLNIVNNVQGLRMGQEMRNFKDFTQDMDPLSRGDAIDGFDFVKKIHNSFARENDLMIADLHCRQKATKAQKRQALAKAREAREAKKNADLASKGTPVKKAATPERASTRTRKQPAKIAALNSAVSSSPLSDPPESDADFETPSKSKKLVQPQNGETRRSSRPPKPRKDTFAVKAAVKDEDEEEGFHFIAYMPIQGHVWRMDGLDSFPQELGAFDAADAGGWMSIAQPALQTRMAMYEGADIEFNLMAVVHDPLLKDREDLMQNTKALQAVDKKLDKVFADWRELEGGETRRDVITGISEDFSITQADIDTVTMAAHVAGKLESEEDMLRLIELRKEILSQQAPLRGAVRDAIEMAKGDEEKAQHRRHDYGKFVRSWLGALAENELVTALLEDGPSFAHTNGATSINGDDAGQ